MPSILCSVILFLGLVASAGAQSPLSTTISLVTSANPSIFGQPLTLRATVTPGTATGSVTFYDGVIVLGTLPLVGGQATLTTSLLPSGSGSLKVYYGGDGADMPSTSAVVAQTVTPVPSAGFAPAAIYAVSGYPNSVKVDDFNGDGRPDLAVATAATGNVVSVLLGNGDGTFQAAVNYVVSGASISVATGDFNGDGNPDLAVAVMNDISGPSSVGVLLGNGDGTFQGAVDYGLVGIPTCVAAADFNGDGKIDLALSVATTGGQETLTILLGNGDGTFQPPRQYVIDGVPHSVAVGDFNGDGKPDLAIAVSSGLNANSMGNISVLLGNGDGTFQAAANYGVGLFPTSVAVGDFTGDGKTDLAVADEFSNNLDLLLGNGDGTFQTAVNYEVSGPSDSAAVGDFNGDGKLDLVAPNIDSTNLMVLLGNGDGTFQSELDFPSAGNEPAFVAVGDLNRDGRTDIIAALRSYTTGQLSVLLGESSTSSTTMLTLAPLSSDPLGQPLSLTATVASIQAFSVPTGVVNFLDGGTVFGTASLMNGTATISATGLASGSHVFYAEYLGNATTTPSTSSAARLAVTGGPLWSINILPNGSLTQGQVGASYTITLTNSGVLPTSGMVSVTEMPPSGLTLVSMSGLGWTCFAETCSRNEGLIPESSYPPITVVVNVAGYAPTPLTNMATVSGGGPVPSVASFTATVLPAPPFGYIDTPTNNMTGVAGAIGVTGWALSGVGVETVAVWREPVPSENPNRLVYIGNADIIAGSRPDIAKAYPGYPNNNYGWGLQILTNELPNSSGQPGIGNGTFNLHALVTDNAGQVADIGTRTIGVNNATSVLPFGTIDTPTQGGTESGTFVNFGWVVTPQPNIIPIDGSTIWVYIDNVRVGHPVYNNYRTDIATLFPGLQNSEGAVGYYYIDTTTLANGLHTIAWVASDSAGNAVGLGSRYFNVQN